MHGRLIERTLRAAPFIFVAALAPLLCACAAMTRPAGAGTPGASEGPKFATLEASDERRKAALANWREITGQPAATTTATTAPTPELQPVTATLKTLPANLQTQPRMPLVKINDKAARKTNGDKAAKNTDEETRESLRRFMSSAAPLVGVELSELSLVEIVDAQLDAMESNGPPADLVSSRPMASLSCAAVLSSISALAWSVESSD